MKELFLLDPDVIFLNHGSFGATPKAVFAAYQDWQRRLEKQPVAFLGRELKEYITKARADLAHYLNAAPDALIYVPNATFGVNVVARSLALAEGDEVLTCDQEYGACDNVWSYLSQRQGFRYKKQTIPLPVNSSEEIIEMLWQGVTPATKVIFLSHITSPTALILPVAQICARARAQGILTVIDGAHAPGQIPLDLRHIDADFYTGNCHKWLCSPKGAGFLYTRSDKQALIEPLIISWGFSQEITGSPYLDYYIWVGTQDPSAYLAVSAAIAFQKEHNWPAVQLQAHQLLQGALQKALDLTGLPAPYPVNGDLYAQMAIFPLPDIDPEAFKEELYHCYRIEAPVTMCGDHAFLRVSVQAYNTPEDLVALDYALKKLLA